MLTVIKPLISNLLLWIWITIFLFICWITRGNRQFRRYGFCFLTLFWILSTRPAVDAILWPLESSFSPPNISSLKSQEIDQIVVLSGGGGEIRSDLLISAFPHATAYRLWGALELASRLGPNCELVFIGSPNGDTRVMEELAHVLMPARKVVSKTHMGGTSEHPKNVEGFVAERAFVLVTSAMHMKRAMRCFELQGLKPVAYPVDF